jgi:hypothetical protein
MKRIWRLIILSLIVLESCMPLPREATRRIPFRDVSEPALWTVDERPAYLIVTEGNWSAYYSNPPAGSDFHSFIYVVVSLGMKPNPGYTVRIEQIERVQDMVTVKVDIKQPDPRKIYPQVIVHPTAVAQVAKADLEPGGLLNLVFTDQNGQRLTTLKTEV